MIIGAIYIDTVCNTIRMFSHKIQKLHICGRDMVGCVLNQLVLVMHSSKFSPQIMYNCPLGSVLQEVKMLDTYNIK